MASRPCLICTSPTRNAHLGVDACRACAAFFKRTLTSGRNFTCRQGTGKCTIRKKESFLCRKCRFDRCKELGMQWDGKKEEMDPMEGTSEGIEEIPEIRTAADESILAKIMREYKNSCERRKEAESSLRSSSSSEHIRVKDSPNEVFLSKCDFSFECMRINIEGNYSFTSRAFSRFASLTPVEQCLIIGKCNPTIFLLEGNFMSKKIFDNDKYFMVSLTTSLHLDALDFFFSNELDKKQDIIKAMKFYTKKQVEYTWPLIERANLTETEFVVLIATVIWQFGNAPSIPSSLCSIGEEILSEVYSDLHRYYREELRLSEYSSRMGNLLSLGHSLLEASCLLEEEFTVYSLMDLFLPDAICRKLFL